MVLRPPGQCVHLLYFLLSQCFIAFVHVNKNFNVFCFVSHHYFVSTSSGSCHFELNKKIVFSLKSCTNE